jgi:hypothetical protein
MEDLVASGGDPARISYRLTTALTDLSCTMNDETKCSELRETLMEALGKSHRLDNESWQRSGGNI